MVLSFSPSDGVLDMAAVRIEGQPSDLDILGHARKILQGVCYARVLPEPKDEKAALAAELAAMTDPMERREREDEQKLAWKLKMKRENKRRREEVNKMTAAVAKVQECRAEVLAQPDDKAKRDKVLGYLEVLSKAWMEERQASWSQDVALSAMRSGFRDFVREIVTHIGGEVKQLRDNVGKFREGAIQGAKAAAAVEGEGRPRKDPVKLKFPDAYGGKKDENFDNWEASVNSYIYLQHILIEEQVLVAFQALKDEAASFARSLACTAGCENNLVAYSKVTPLSQFLKLLKERFADPTRGIRAYDKLQTIHSRQWRSAKALKGTIAVPDHGVTEPQLVQLFYRAIPEALRGHFFDKSQQAGMTYDALSREVVLYESKSMPVTTFWHKDLEKGKKWKDRTISGQVKPKDHLILTLEEGGTEEVPYDQIEWGLGEEYSSVGQGRSYVVRWCTSSLSPVPRCLSDKKTQYLLKNYRQLHGIAEGGTTTMETQDADSEPVICGYEETQPPTAAGMAPPKTASRTESVAAAEEGPAEGSGSNTRVASLQQTSMKRWLDNDAQKKLDIVWAEAMFRAGIAFNFLKFDTTQKLHEVYLEVASARPKVKLPSYNHMRTVMLNFMYLRIQKQVHPLTTCWDESGCTFITDGSSDRRERPVMNFLAAGEKGAVQVATVSMTARKKTAQALAKLWEQIMREIGVHRINAICTDNAEVNKKAAQLLERRTDKDICTDSMARWTRIRWSTTKLKSKADLVYFTMRRDGWWTELKKVVDVMEPLYNLLRRMDRDGTSPTNIVKYDDMIERKLAHVVLTKEQRASVMDKVRDRVKMMRQPVHALAFLLDPRRRNPRWLYDRDSAIVQNAMHYLQRQVGGPWTGPYHLEVLGDLHEFHKEPTPNGPKRKDKKMWKPDAKVDCEKLTPSEWWATYGGDVPDLQAIAIKVMGMWSTTTPAERNWSSMDFVHSKRRNNLKPETLEKLVYIHWNMQLLRAANNSSANGEGYVDLWSSFFEAIQEPDENDGSVLRGPEDETEKTDEELVRQSSFVKTPKGRIPKKLEDEEDECTDDSDLEDELWKGKSGLSDEASGAEEEEDESDSDFDLGAQPSVQGTTYVGRREPAERRKEKQPAVSTHARVESSSHYHPQSDVEFDHMDTDVELLLQSGPVDEDEAEADLPTRREMERRKKKVGEKEPETRRALDTVQEGDEEVQPQSGPVLKVADQQEAEHRKEADQQKAEHRKEAEEKDQQEDNDDMDHLQEKEKEHGKEDEEMEHEEDEEMEHEEDKAGMESQGVEKAMEQQEDAEGMDQQDTQHNADDEDGEEEHQPAVKAVYKRRQRPVVSEQFVENAPDFPLSNEAVQHDNLWVSRGGRKRKEPVEDAAVKPKRARGRPRKLKTAEPGEKIK
ncbi:hypothetical protein CBR_g27789 [Chara braunii]|uniref:HAT C-terminal dimerisation domain-containing protein n=1 Tax=Chara braunii TaxID=69332 RepID=A0A388L8C9_CHABU|nr:hypothetical protein CBR_g27789 [Chara braunii]|eukprot:GBG78565.1 hypothetical protein CBR_g27789 [Chara braunii]